MKIVERNLQQIGQSLLVSLPKEWTRTFKLKKHDSIRMIVSEQGNLIIAPEFVKQEENKEATIIFDGNFRRRFFREYFHGNEKIIIEFREKISERERKDVYEFLQKFMNLQIIEETKEKVVVKCFRIEELSMEECLKRMHFLSLNMIDEVIEGKSKTKMQEMRDTMTRFYYMLVMQIRIFLDEGKFTRENQISLLKAVDMRMVAEKIQRIGEIVENMNEKNINLLKEIESYYDKSFNYFMKSDFEKSLLLWSEGNSLGKKCGKNHELGQIARFGKEISMLVR